MPIARLIVSGLLLARKKIQGGIRNAYCGEYKHRISVLETELELALTMTEKHTKENRELRDRNKDLVRSLENATDALQKRAERLRNTKWQ